jgi:prepilin-type N-terminal cleavage/methylation domain-containing protein
MPGGSPSDGGRTMHKLQADQRGFTLLEVVLSFSLLAVLSIPFASFIHAVRTELQENQHLAELQAELSGFETMARREIYNALRVETVPSGIMIEQADGDRIKFYMSGERLYRTIIVGSDNAGHNPVLAHVVVLLSETEDGGRIWHLKGRLGRGNNVLPFEYRFFMPLADGTGITR